MSLAKRVTLRLGKASIDKAMPSELKAAMATAAPMAKPWSVAPLVRVAVGARVANRPSKSPTKATIPTRPVIREISR